MRANLFGVVVGYEWVEGIGDRDGTGWANDPDGDGRLPPQGARFWYIGGVEVSDEIA